MTAIQDIITWQAAHQEFFAYSENSGRLDPVHSGYTDCSGLTRWLYLHFADINIGTWTGDECTNGDLITTSKSDARNGVGMLPGDLVFYRWSADSPATFDHVNMFVGDGHVQNHGGPGRGPVVQSLASNVDAAATVMVRRYIPPQEKNEMQLTDTISVPGPDGQPKDVTVAFALHSIYVNAKRAADVNRLASAVIAALPADKDGSLTKADVEAAMRAVFADAGTP